MKRFTKKNLTFKARRFLDIFLSDLKFRFNIPTPIINEDRHFLEKPIFSYLNSIANASDKLLFMGVAPYTWHYYSQLEHDVYTIDYDKKRAKFGNKDKHTIGSITTLNKHYEKNFFKIIIANGLIGHGLNGKDQFEAMLKMCHECLSEKGILIIGYNDNAAHLNFSLNDACSYKMFDEYVPDIAQMNSPSIKVNPDNDHTFLFLRKV